MAGEQNKRNLPYIKTGTVDTNGGWVDLTYGADGKTFADFVKIRNSGGTNTLLFSFDNVTFFGVPPTPAQPVDVDWRVNKIFLKAAAATTTYEVLCTSGKHFRPY